MVLKHPSLSRPASNLIGGEWVSLTPRAGKPAPGAEEIQSLNPAMPEAVAGRERERYNEP